MRIRLSRQHDERGAIAIMSALLICFVLLIIGALVIDFGMAYTNKRQAQVAADAGVLAAAKFYSLQNGSCPNIDDDLTLKSQAEAIAADLREQNLPHSVGTGFDAACNAQGELEISYAVSYDSVLGLGQLATNTDHVTVQQSATASFDRPLKGESGMRPWPICSNVIPVAGDKTVQQVVAGSDANPNCHLVDIAKGTWERFNCSGYDKGNGADNKPTSSIYWITFGCPNPSSPVPTSATDPSQLRVDLINYCGALSGNSTATESCLTRDTGSAQNDKMVQAWQSVVNAGLTLEIPVVCTMPSCSPQDAITPQGVLPIWRIAVVRICGFRLSDQSGKPAFSTWSSTSSCAAANNPAGWKADSPVPKVGGDKDPNAFYLSFEGLIGSNDNGAQSGSSNLRLTE